MEITQNEINVLATKAGRISELLQEVNKIAFELAKVGNTSGVIQLRGAFSGTLADDLRFFILKHYSFRSSVFSTRIVLFCFMRFIILHLLLVK